MAHLFTARCTFYPTVLRGVPLAFNDPRKESKRAFLFFCPMDKKNDMRILVSDFSDDLMDMKIRLGGTDTEMEYIFSKSKDSNNPDESLIGRSFQFRTGLQGPRPQSNEYIVSLDKKEDTADLLENLDEWAQKQWIDHVERRYSDENGTTIPRPPNE